VAVQFGHEGLADRMGPALSYEPEKKSDTLRQASLF
jgi:hypothetical protein